LTIRGDDKANYVALLDRLRRGKRIVIHGSTGSKAKECGMPRLENVWSGAGGLTHPYVVWGNHEDCIRDGGKIIIGDTLSTAMNIMADAIDAASDRGVNVVAIMLTGVHYIDKCLEIAERHWFAYSVTMPTPAISSIRTGSLKTPSRPRITSKAAHAG
jgi:hypothetical protein